jgi:hypothetical protein
VPIEGLQGWVAKIGTCGARHGGSLPPLGYEHARGRKVSVGCGRKWYRYEEDAGSKKCAGQKAGESAEGGDGGVNCGGQFPGNGFPDDGEREDADNA